MHIITAHGDHKHDMLESMEDNVHADEDISKMANKDPSKMTPDEKEFYYFKQHDFDNNDFLDGLELIQAMVNYEKLDIEDRGGSTKGYPMLEEEQFIEMVDAVMRLEDLDDDGLINFYEFKLGQKKKKERQMARNKL